MKVQVRTCRRCKGIRFTVNYKANDLEGYCRCKRPVPRKDEQ